MKTSYFLLLCISLSLWTSCNTNSPTDNEIKTPREQKKADEEVIGVVPYEGGIISEQTQNFLEGLTTGYWYIAGYVSIKEPEKAVKENTGRWFQFTADGHLKAGKWKDEITKGTWTYHPSIAVLTIRTEDPSFQGEYKIKMTKDKAIMIWIGTERFNQTDVQAKLETYLQLMDTLP